MNKDEQYNQVEPTHPKNNQYTTIQKKYLIFVTNQTNTRKTD